MVDLSDSIIPHYERHARDWAADRNRAAWNDKPWHDRFIASLPEGARVLDLGCGSGTPVAEHMVARGMAVTGVDASPTLIALCRARLPDQTWILADMRTLSLGERFHGVLAWDSFFHLNFDDQRHMFEVFDRHCSGSAVLMFNAGPARREAIGAFRGAALYHASLAPSEYEVRLRQIGFEIDHHVVEDRNAGGRTAWLARASISRSAGKRASSPRHACS